ncbi:hypothetical protein LOK49_LG05G01032 [Camellia lanceoleosa]|uniref:Uncharacterized protein n=1 Tax=Camellia lanceoleosa TaxID=1840588 RepID=A0ACC0HNF4_9ERIC|nr:hypothetical protein LOK49_LG05G01032 [Camellia lanceoleosa]
MSSLSSTLSSHLNSFGFACVHRKVSQIKSLWIGFGGGGGGGLHLFYLHQLSEYAELRKLTWKERYLVLKEASRLYAASWVRDIGPDLHPNDYEKDDSEEKHNGVNGATKEKEPSTLEDLVVAARGGMETLRPALQRVYMTRASAYRDALKSFIEGAFGHVQSIFIRRVACE